MFEDVYKEMPPHLARQRDELLALSKLQPPRGPDEEHRQTQAVAKEG
jgi:hypothetical protein